MVESQGRAAAHEGTGIFLHSWQFSMLGLLWLWDLPLENGWEKHSPEQLEPHSRSLLAWHQNGSSQGLCKKSLGTFGECFVKAWENTQIYSTLALTLPLPATTPFRRLIRFCCTSFSSNPVTSEYFLPSFHALSPHFWYWVWHCNANAFLDTRLGKRGGRSGWWGKICWLRYQITWNMERQRPPDSILWERRHSFSLLFTRLRNERDTILTTWSDHSPSLAPSLSASRTCQGLFLAFWWVVELCFCGWAGWPCPNCLLEESLDPASSKVSTALSGKGLSKLWWTSWQQVNRDGPCSSLC